MKLNKMIKVMITAMTLSTLAGAPAMADWQYTLYGPVAVWTNTVTGEQTTVYAGQPAPDGTAAPTLALTQENTTASYDVNAAIAAANAAVDAAKAARGGSTGSVISQEQMAANTAAANVNMNTNTVTVINGVSSGSRASGLSNAELPMISTGDQTQYNSTGLSDGTYVGPGNSVSAKISGGKVSTQDSSYVAKDGHIVTNAQAPDVTAVSVASSGSTGSNGTASVPGTSTATSTAASTGNTVVNYSGTLPSTGAGNVSTYSTPVA
ncbi:hypothetical protein BXO88_00505 [Oribacterium sp. C9]|uniref:hypothetical protein n=1 Tax=Oribacterium sp. C9 TaxID=1943579 RepID=UPI00098FB696|nr:hypothetical protein [Oribacterium sp. C9]OON88312.1 hypothetical protein BXO88_00505 [Oribacterium sp. C9]